MRETTIEGKKFNRLFALNFLKKEKIVGQRGYHHYWLFKCDCGKLSVARKNAVVAGQTKSCGCFNREQVSKIMTTHGFSKSRIYQIWEGMQNRCNRPNAHKYHLYGGKGIKILWTNFQEFKDDMYESYVKHLAQFGEKNTTIDRIDSNDNYCKENCRWATYKEQARNSKKK